jgi:hypothetical protein
MDINKIRNHWYANIYDKEVTETDDVEFLLGRVHTRKNREKKR